MREHRLHDVLPHLECISCKHTSFIRVGVRTCSAEPVWHGALLAGAHGTAACCDHWQHQGHRQGTCSRVPAVRRLAYQWMLPIPMQVYIEASCVSVNSCSCYMPEHGGNYMADALQVGRLGCCDCTLCSWRAHNSSRAAVRDGAWYLRQRYNLALFAAYVASQSSCQ